MLRKDAPGCLSRGTPVSVTSTRRPRSRARSTSAARIAPCAPRPRCDGRVAAAPSHPGLAALEERAGTDGLAAVVGDEAVPARPTDDAGREIPERGREAVALREGRSEIGGRLGVDDAEIRTRVRRLEPSLELLPRVIRDEPERLQLVVEARLRIECDPERIALVPRSELAERLQVVQPDDAIQLADGMRLAAHGDGAGAPRQLDRPAG
jgi:hypothetical protein